MSNGNFTRGNPEKQAVHFERVIIRSLSSECKKIYNSMGKQNKNEKLEEIKHLSNATSKVFCLLQNDRKEGNMLLFE